MATSDLVSMTVMGALVVLVLAAAVRNRQWYHHRPQAAVGTERGRDGPSDRMGLWIGAFLLLVVAAVGGVFAFMQTSPAVGSLTGGPLVVGALAVVAGYFLLGVYTAARSRGHANSIAVAETVTAGGALFLLAVASQLVGA